MAAKKRKQREQRVMSAIGKRALKLMMQEMRAHAQEAFGWTDEQWAKRAGSCVSTIWRLEKGEFVVSPLLDTVVRLASAVHLNAVLADAGTVELRLQRNFREGIRITESGKIASLGRGTKAKGPKAKLRRVLETA